MKRHMLIMMLGLLTITLVISACGAGGGPEKVVRDYIAAINAGNYEKARQYASPDRRDYLERTLENVRECEIKYPSIREIVVRDSILGRDQKDVTVMLERTWNPDRCPYVQGYGYGHDYGKKEIEMVFHVEKLKGHWYISYY